MSVGGRVERNPKRWVRPESAGIRVEGLGEARRQKSVTIALHKPAGVVTTRSDERGRPTVYSLLGGLDAHVVPVGRLDLATTGLLLLTNDTQLAAWLTDPTNEVERVYLVTVRGELTHVAARRLEEGIVESGERLQATRIEIRKASGRESHLVVELREGKNREIRRLFKSAGHEVTRLKRVSFGGIELGDLPLGKWRIVADGELPLGAKRAPLGGFSQRPG